MPIPASLLTEVERHSCFSGCFSRESEVNVCLDPARSLEPMVFVSCRDCLTYKVGVLQTLLPPGTSADSLADQLTQHMRAVRGFSMSFGGYHARGPGFWLSAAYYAGCNVYLIDGARSRNTGSDLDLLLLAFKHGVAHPPDPRMLDPRFYIIQTIYLNFSAPIQPVNTVHDLLTSPQCRLQPTSGFNRVTLAEFLPGNLGPSLTSPGPAIPLGPGATSAPPPPPVASSSPNATVTVSTSPKAAAKSPPLRKGEICPLCNAEVRERPLLNGTFVGCLC